MNQMVSNFKRRLRSYLNNPREIYISMMPFVLPMIYIIVILMVFAKLSDTGNISKST